MLTQRDIDLAAKGLVSIDRLKALQHALRAHAARAREFSRTEGMDERRAASLRGKANAFDVSAAKIGHLIAGNPIKRPWWARFRRSS